MQRRYRVLRTRRGHLLKVPPAAAVSAPFVPPLIHQHRKARLPPHHRRQRHLLWTPPPPVPPPVIFTYGVPYFRWSYGTPYTG